MDSRSEELKKIRYGGFTSGLDRALLILDERLPAGEEPTLETVAEARRELELYRDRMRKRSDYTLEDEEREKRAVERAFEEAS